MGHVHDTSEAFSRQAAAPSNGQGADVRFSSDQIAWLCEAGLLAPDIRFELIAGEIVLSPAESGPHALTKSRIHNALARLVPRDIDVGSNISLRLSDASVLEPDVLLWRPNLRGTYFKADEALLAIEVSLSSLKRDLEIKPAFYAEAGVPEIWVVDVEAEQTHVFTDPRGAGYRQRTTYAFTDPIPLAVAPAGRFVIADLLG